MKLDLTEMGVKVRGKKATFRLWLPNLDPEARVLAVGSFCNWKPEEAVSLKYDSKKGTWKGVREDIEDGEHTYRYLVKTDLWYSNPSPDPFAKATTKDGVPMFSVPPEKPARIDDFTPPPLNELVLYHLNLDNFNLNFEGVKRRLIYYLSQLGVNGIVFTPWIGYDRKAGGEKVPLQYFAADGSYGTPYDLRVLINECHKIGIAVIMDIDLHGASPSFGINEMFPLFSKKPMMGRLDNCGKRVYLNYSDQYTRDFVFEVCRYWLDDFNIDGFRFLNAANFWDSSEGHGLADLAKKIHKIRQEDEREFYLFADQCGALSQEILNRSAVNAVSNHTFMEYIHHTADTRRLPSEFWKTMDLNQLNYSDQTLVEDDLVSNTALNMMEDDHSHSLIVKMGVLSNRSDVLGNPVGDRKNNWWKVKPFIIAQFTATGIPMIHNGQEIGENRYLPEKGPDRFKPRPINWQYISDFAGKDLFRFHQKLTNLRMKFKSLRSRNFFHYYTDMDRQVVAFKRYQDDEQVVVAINFSNESSEIDLAFPSDGVWREYLDDYTVQVLKRKAVVKVPARYGVVFFQDDKG